MCFDRHLRTIALDINIFFYFRSLERCNILRIQDVLNFLPDHLSLRLHFFSFFPETSFFLWLQIHPRT